MAKYMGKGYERDLEIPDPSEIYAHIDLINRLRDINLGPNPIPKSSLRNYNELMAYMDGRFSLSDVYKQIQDKTCLLPKRVRDYVLFHFDSEGNFKSVKK